MENKTLVVSSYSRYIESTDNFDTNTVLGLGVFAAKIVDGKLVLKLGDGKTKYIDLPEVSGNGQPVKGEKGDKGDKGDPGVDGKDGLTTAIKVGDTTYNHVEGLITLEGIATESFVTTEIAKASFPDKEIDLSGFVTKDDLTGLASEQFVTDQIAAIDIPDVSGFLTEIPDQYVTETELNDKGFLTEHQDLSQYALKSEVSNFNGNDYIYNKQEVEELIAQRILQVNW